MPTSSSAPAPAAPRHLRAADLRGLAQLATQATRGIARITEGVHQSVWQTLGARGGALPGQTAGLTGLVYRSVHGVTGLVGLGLDRALRALEPLLESDAGPAPASPQREAVLAALNGVMGDRLAASGSPFATPMTLRWQGQALGDGTWPAEAAARPRLLLLVHGLCMNDLQWQTRHAGQAVDHGQALAAALDATPVYLRYNTGLHTSQNGRALAHQLEGLLRDWPLPLEEITIVGHSMGGLLARSAVHCALEEGLRWPARLKHLVFLGTPHHGAPLERAGHGVDILLGSNRWSAPFARLAELRSAGITDLRHGHVRDEDWAGRHRFQHRADQRVPLPLPEGVACWVIAATTAARRSPLADRLVGDGLVPLRSALGQHPQARHRLKFAAGAQSIFYRTGHLALLARPEVTRQLLRWLAPGPVLSRPRPPGPPAAPGP
jgi:hypothetical protein